MSGRNTEISIDVVNNVAFGNRRAERLPVAKLPHQPNGRRTVRKSLLRRQYCGTGPWDLWSSFLLFLRKNTVITFADIICGLKKWLHKNREWKIGRRTIFFYIFWFVSYVCHKKKNDLLCSVKTNRCNVWHETV